MTPDALLAQVNAELEAVAARWTARFPEQSARIARAVGLVKAGEIVASEEAGAWWVRGHAVEAGRCDCKDHEFRGGYGTRCAHRWALNLAARVEALPAHESEQSAFLSYLGV